MPPRPARRSAANRWPRLKAQLADRVKGIEDLAAPRAGAARGRRAAGPAHRSAVHQVLARCPGGRRGSLAHGRSGLAGPGPGIAGRPELGQRRHEVPALAGGFARPAAGGLGCIPERAGPGRDGGRGSVGAAAAGAGMGRRTARRARRAGGSAGQAGQTQGRSRGARASHPGRARGARQAGAGDCRKATARPAPARPRPCAMRSRNTAS